MVTSITRRWPVVAAAAGAALACALAACTKSEAPAPASAPTPVLMQQTEPDAQTPAPVAAPADDSAARQERALNALTKARRQARQEKELAAQAQRKLAAPQAAPGADSTKAIELPAAAPRPAPASYSVDLRATERLQMWGTPGQMRVWIGDPQYIPPKDEGMVEKTMPLGVTGQSARVAPFVQGEISVAPAEPTCGKLAPSGAEFLYTLTPRAAGHYTVGAKIDVFDTPDCSGPNTPKATRSIAVDVQACWWCLLAHAATELLTRAWHAFLEFWDKLLLVFFGLLLILLRKQIGRLFGLKPKDGAAEK